MNKYLLFTLLLLNLTASAFGDETITLTSDKIITKNFHGFGAEWDTHNYSAAGITDEDFQLITGRIQKLKLPIVRIMMLGKYCYRGNGKFDWNSDSMKFIYKQLDFCQQHGIKVILCSWGAGGNNTTDWMNIPGITGADDPEYANVVGTFMDYLINTKGYSCIKYFAAGNEPDGELKNDWNLWKKSVTNIAANLKKRGLSQKLVLVGPETTHWTAKEWLKNSSSQLPELLGVFSIHNYPLREFVKTGKTEPYLFDLRENIIGANSLTANIPFFITEAGMGDELKTNGNVHISEYEYGIFIVDYAVQAARSGCSAILAWMLDDNSHRGFSWGMWENKTNGFKTRPWYYSWSLLTRNFPVGSDIYRVIQPKDVKILAARIPSNSIFKADDWSLCFVNRATMQKTITVKIPEVKNIVFMRYEYRKDKLINDADFFIKPLATEKFEINKGIKVVCPPDSVLVLTSLQL